MHTFNTHYAHWTVVADVHMRYRMTDETHQRPVFEVFEPRYAVSQEVIERLRAIERLDQDLRGADLDAGASGRLLRDALSRNAYGTASIEGNPLTLGEVQSLLRVGPTPDNMVVPTEREIINWSAFMEELPPEAPRHASDVLELHARLFEGVMDDAGQFKQEPNFVGRADGVITFIPAAPERVEAELANGFAWLHGAAEHPIIRAIVWFHDFEGIHPFRDGNGRVGRALLTWLLHAFGYPGIRYALVDYTFNRDRADYYGNLARVEHNDYDFTSWIDYMTRVLEETFRDAAVRVRLAGAEDLNPRQVDVALWFRRILDGNTSRRVKFADVQAAFPHVPRRTLQEDLKHLVAAGVIGKTGQRKGTTYGQPAGDAQAAGTQAP